MPKTICSEFSCFECIRNKEFPSCDRKVTNATGSIQTKYMNNCPPKCPRRAPQDLKIVFDENAGRKAQKVGKRK